MGMSNARTVEEHPLLPRRNGSSNADVLRNLVMLMGAGISACSLSWTYVSGGIEHSDDFANFHIPTERSIYIS